MCFLVLLLFTMPLNYVHGDSFLPVANTCKYWDPVSVFRTAHDVVLHCILDENYNLGIVNTTWKLISKGHCPFFNRHTGDIDIFNCNENDGGCPTSAFASYQATQSCRCHKDIYKHLLRGHCSVSGCMKENRLRMENIETSFTCTSNLPDQQLLVWFKIIAATLMVMCVSMICDICCRHVSKKKIWQTLFKVEEKVKKRMKSNSKSTWIETGVEEIGNPESQGAKKMVPPVCPEDSTSPLMQIPIQEANDKGEDANDSLRVETLDQVGKVPVTEKTTVIDLGVCNDQLQIKTKEVTRNDTQYTPYNKGHDAIQRKISLEEISMSENSVAPSESVIVVPRRM